MPLKMGQAGLTLKIDTTGTVTADGLEDTIIDKVLGSPFKGQLILDLSNLGSRDSIIVKEYTKITSTGSLQLLTSTTFTAVQAEPAAVFLVKNLAYEHKITLQQVLGTYRTFPYTYYVED